MAVAKIDGFGGGAEARVAAIAARHERTLLRIARQASLCHDDALDAYQRALEIFVRRVETVDPATELAWLKVVVRHEAMAIRRARTESVAGEELDLDAFVPSGERSVEERLAAEQRVQRSAEALRALKPDEAEALMLKAHGLSYDEIGARNGWSYTKVNRAVTEGRRRFLAAYRGIESGAECERFAPIVEALGDRTASAAQMLQIRPHLRHCAACRAAVRDLHLSRLRRASLFWPVFVVAEPLGRLSNLRHDVAAVFHRAQASDLATGAGVAGSGGGGRIASIGAVVGLCLGGASVGTVCVVTDSIPLLASDPPARQAARVEPKREAPKQAAPEARPVRPVATVSVRSAARRTSPPSRSAPSEEALLTGLGAEGEPGAARVQLREPGTELRAGRRERPDERRATAAAADSDLFEALQPSGTGVRAVISLLRAFLTPLAYCLLASTILGRLVRGTLCATAAICALLLAAFAPNASAGVFVVASCQADRLNYSTRAFTHFATRRMMIKRACNPQGPGLRGLITANVVHAGRVQRGSVALVTIAAPPGTRMTSFSWAGEMRRHDCRYALQMWADAPGIRIPIKNVRANRRCPSPGRAQAAYDPPKDYNVAGATRIVQRIICVGKHRRDSCSGRGRNYIRTYKASVGIVDDFSLRWRSSRTRHLRPGRG